MYCHHCGTQLPDGSNFCSNCGTRQAAQGSNTKTTPVNPSQPKSGFRIPLWLIIVAVVALAVMINSNSTAGSASKKASNASASSKTTVIPDGWNSSHDSYYQDGSKLTGEQYIDGKYYYFDNSGYLMRNAEIPEYFGSSLTDENGILSYYIYDEVPASWAEDLFRFEDGTHVSVLNLEYDIVQCEAFTFLLEATSTNNVSIDGAWSIYVRCSGEWSRIATFQFQEPSTPMHITGVPNGSFDGVMARPLDPKGAQWNCTYKIQNVICRY